jgi:hypothetical protein
MLPEAESAIGFALPLNKDLIRPFLAKEYPNARGDHEMDNIEVNKKVTEISREVADLLIEQRLASLPPEERKKAE